VGPTQCRRGQRTRSTRAHRAVLASKRHTGRQSVEPNQDLTLQQQRGNANPIPRSSPMEAPGLTRARERAAFTAAILCPLHISSIPAQQPPERKRRPRVVPVSQQAANARKNQKIAKKKGQTTHRRRGQAKREVPSQAVLPTQERKKNAPPKRKVRFPASHANKSSRRSPSLAVHPQDKPIAAQRPVCRGGPAGAPASWGRAPCRQCSPGA
jgi:hypothetical protein